MQYVTRYDGNFYISNCPCAGQGLGGECRCGEDQEQLDWVWDPESSPSDIHLLDDGKEAMFHPNYSSGTAAIRGTEPLNLGQQYWEVKMTTPVYGTDMMVGVMTKQANLDDVQNKFTSLLGQDGESWGMSYEGVIRCNGSWKRYARHRIGQGTVVGLHLDNWHGTLSYYLNGQPQGVAFDGLQGKILYPAICSTAARSGMKVVATQCFNASLQFLCCQKLRMCVRPDKDVLDSLPFPPGLAIFLRQHLNWLLRAPGIPYTHTRFIEHRATDPWPQTCRCHRVSCNNCLSQVPSYLAFPPADYVLPPVFSHLIHRPWELRHSTIQLLPSTHDTSPQPSPTSDDIVEYDPIDTDLYVQTRPSSAQPSTSRGLYVGDTKQRVGGATGTAGTGSNGLICWTCVKSRDTTSDEHMEQDSPPLGHEAQPETCSQASSCVGQDERRAMKRKTGASMEQDFTADEDRLSEGADSDEDTGHRKTCAGKWDKQRIKKHHPS